MRPVPHLVVGRNGARVRDGVEMEGADIIMDLARGTRVLVVERGISSVPVHAARCRILTADGSTGWVSERCISPIEPSPPDLTQSSIRMLTATAVVRAADADSEDGPAATPAARVVARRTRAPLFVPQRRPPHSGDRCLPMRRMDRPRLQRAHAVAHRDAARSALHAVTTSAAFRAAVPHDAEEGPATTPAGSRSRASDAARSALRAATTSAAFRGPAAIWPEDGPAATPPGAPAPFAQVYHQCTAGYASNGSRASVPTAGSRRPRRNPSLMGRRSPLSPPPRHLVIMIEW